jgi:predicted ATPase
MGLGGQKLAAFLYELGSDKRRRLAKVLKTVYPQLSELLAKSIRSGWKQLEIIEDYEGDDGQYIWPVMRTEARHINEGMLRQIAILAELESEHGFLLFDEVENGVNPELVEFLLKELRDTDKQVVVTTHSPLILNYLDDESARESVIYLFKTKEGYTKSIRFFSIPSLKKKLTVMGPGEAFVDTNLVDLAEEIKSIPESV